MKSTEKKPNAQKWTAERVHQYLNVIDKEARAGRGLFLGQILTMYGLPRHVWSYWKRTFANDGDILEQMYVIDTILEAKIFDAGLKGIVPAKVVINTLKLTYGWRKESFAG